MTPEPAPGSVKAARERVGSFRTLVKTLPRDAVVFADARVLRLHPTAARALSGHRLVRLVAGEGLKSLSSVERLAIALRDVPRGARFVALGGGTVGDLVTVLAHLHKRGVALTHVPTTLLAAADSSVGGKGAVNVGGVKNALGVFHAPDETWLCPAFFETLSESQRREGRLEAWKMVTTLDGATFRRWVRATPTDEALLRVSRTLKEAVVRSDPYERRGVRAVLNFGHTFGHVIESLTGHRVRHGDAVGLGMLCALDVGVALGVTPPGVARMVEAALPVMPKARARLGAVVRSAAPSRVARLLASDKKRTGTALTMVLLELPGRWRLVEVPERVWRTQWGRWARG